MSQIAIEIHQEWGHSHHIASQKIIESLGKPPQSLFNKTMLQ
jgi:hypothetical protein